MWKSVIDNTRFRAVPAVVWAVLCLATIAIQAFAQSWTKKSGTACSSNVTWACSTCATSGDLYQCMFSELGSDENFGACSSVEPMSNCWYAPFSCGSFDYDCADPPSRISGSNCFDQQARICTDVQPPPPPPPGP